MIVSHKKKFIMLLPWKTASQTLYARLEDYDESQYGGTFEFNPFLNRIVSPHLTRADLQALPESRLGYFTASFVRNPYDRVYSGFRQLQRDVATHPSSTFPSHMVRGLILQQLDDIERQIGLAGNDFDNWVRLIEEVQVLEQGRNPCFALFPAYYWTHFGGQKAVDFVGKVETFEADLRRFCDHVGITSLPTTNKNVVELNPASSLGYIGYKYVDRMSAHAVNKINRLFEKDFELFGYTKIEPYLAESGFF
jgi:hypothetical protein